MVTDDEEEESTLVCAKKDEIKSPMKYAAMMSHTPLLRPLAEESEVHLEHGLEETHVGALVQTNLMLPQVDNEHFG